MAMIRRYVQGCVSSRNFSSNINILLQVRQIGTHAEDDPSRQNHHDYGALAVALCIATNSSQDFLMFTRQLMKRSSSQALKYIFTLTTNNNLYQTGFLKSLPHYNFSHDKNIMNRQY